MPNRDQTALPITTSRRLGYDQLVVATGAVSTPADPQAGPAGPAARPCPARATSRGDFLQFIGRLPPGMRRQEGVPPVVARTVEVDLPAQTTLEQAIVALLKLRRGDLPGDATLDQSAVLRFEYTTCEAATPAVPPEEITPQE
jgi:hypothetical protein